MANILQPSKISATLFASKFFLLRKDSFWQILFPLFCVRNNCVRRNAKLLALRRAPTGIRTTLTEESTNRTAGFITVLIASDWPKLKQITFIWGQNNLLCICAQALWDVIQRPKEVIVSYFHVLAQSNDSVIPSNGIAFVEVGWSRYL